VTHSSNVSQKPAYPLDYTAKGSERPMGGEAHSDPTEQIKAFAGQAEDMARKLGDQAQQVGQRVQELAGNLRPALEKSAKEQPMATLAGMAAVGFLLGALWKR
jgi:ElaB/YqjD/DUF883 family membrane-anchored ribosome-binding protein